MSATYTPAPEVRRIAYDLINEHHTHLIAHAVRVEYLFTDKPKSSKGKVALGLAQKIDNLPAFLAEDDSIEAAIQKEREKEFGGPCASEFDLGGDNSETGRAAAAVIAPPPPHDRGDPFFVMTVWEQGWAVLSDRQKLALVDHELCHLWAEADEKTGQTKLSIRPHDLEEFSAIVRRHGNWSMDIEKLVEAAKAGPQLTFDQIAELPADHPSKRDNGSGGGGKSVTLGPGSLDKINRIINQIGLTDITQDDKYDKNDQK